MPIGGPGGADLLQLSISVDGVEVAHKRFTALVARVTNLAPAYEAIGDELRADFALNLTTGGGRYGPWAPLAPSTIAEKARKWPGAPIMVRTGALAQSLASRSAPGNVSQISAMSAMFGTSIPYASFQHFGVPSRHLPARKLVGLSWYTKSKIIKAVADYINGLSGTP